MLSISAEIFLCPICTSRNNNMLLTSKTDKPEDAVIDVWCQDCLFLIGTFSHATLKSAYHVKINMEKNIKKLIIDMEKKLAWMERYNFTKIQ